MSLLNLRPGKMGGIETYMRKMIEHLTQVPDVEMVFFVNDELRVLVPADAEVCNIGWSSFRTIAERLLEAFTPYCSTAAKRLVAAANIDVMFFPHQAMFPLPCPVKSVITVHDLQHLFYPRYFSRFDRTFRATVWKKSLSACDRVVAISQTTADSLVEKCGVPANKITVVHHGCDPIDPSKVGDQSLVNEPYLYYPAASFPHKGHAKLFRSFVELKRGGKVRQQLVLTGMKTKNWKVLEQLIKAEGLEGAVIHLGYLPYDQVFSLYKGADAVLFPTEFEGFGLPVLEAVQFGKKVICSRLPVFDELGVPREWQIDYTQPGQLLRALEAQGPTRLLRAPNTWEDTARQTLGLLKKTASGGNT
jgi:glycosyltransferase involved in cell wall biosynthesis